MKSLQVVGNAAAAEFGFHFAWRLNKIDLKIWTLIGLWSTYKISLAQAEIWR